MSRQQTQGDAPITPAAFQPLNPDAGPARRGPHPVRALVLAVVLVAAVIMGFLFTARSVLITTVATAPAEVEIDGLYLPFGERVLIRPGRYDLAATAEGYFPLQQELIVTREDSQALELTLQPLPGRVTITSEPAGAEVLLDGERIGTTPLEEASISAGEHQLSLRAERYLPWAQTLEVAGRDRAQAVSAELAPAWADISVSSEPAGATVTVDGEPVATTPAVVEVLQGERELGLRLVGYAPWTRSLGVTAGEAASLDPVTLEPAAGILSLNSTPSAANVTLDGEFQGQTPLQLALAPDRAQRITLSRPGYRRHNETLTLAAGEEAQRDIRLQALLGDIRLQVTPEEAEVRVNGKRVGTGSQQLTLPAFEHTLEVVLAGHATERRRVTPREGLEQQLSISLQTQREAKLAALSPEITTALGQTLKLFIPAESALSEFTMGASRRESGRRANEVLRPVALQRMFYLQTTEVTNAQFRQFQAEHNSGQVESNSLNREHQPVAQVSWQQAAQFCNWLSRREGLPPFYQQQEGIVTGFNPEATGYRLPTEAEWAWAARSAGAELLKFPWGETFPPTEGSGELRRQHLRLRHRPHSQRLHRRPRGQRTRGLLCRQQQGPVRHGWQRCRVGARRLPDSTGQQHHRDRPPGSPER